jgi:flagellar hook-length control protein FliK
MRVPNDSPGAAAPPSRAGESATSGSKKFDKVLARKGEEQKARNRGGEPAAPVSEEEGKVLGAMTAMSFLAQRETAPSAIPKTAAAPEVRDLDGLVQEILVVTGPGKNPTVEVQFHSKTLDGLNVQITRNGDEIAIRFMATSSSVAQLLSRNSNQLSQALEAKGLQVAPIRVEVASTSSGSTDSSRSYRDGRRDRGNDRQQRQQK